MLLTLMEEWGILRREGSCTATARVDARTDVDDPVFAGPVFPNSFSVFRSPFFPNPGPGPVGRTCTPELRHARTHVRALAAWFSTVRAESRFPNPTVRAGFADGLKRGTVVSRTDYVNLYIRFILSVRASVRRDGSAF
jgi:hypothetical protein